MFGYIKNFGNKGAWFIGISNIVIFTLLSFAVPRFTHVFDDARIDLPTFSHFILHFHNYSTIFGLIGLVGALLVQFRRHRPGWLLLKISTIALFVSIVATIIAMYLPIIYAPQLIK